MSDTSAWIEIAGAIATAIVGPVKAIGYVQEGELGIKLRFGKARRDAAGQPVISHPGLVLLIPFVDTLAKHHVRQQTIGFADQEVMIRDGLIFHINAAVIFRVVDVYRALFEINDVHGSIGLLGMGVLRDVLATRDYTNLSDTRGISALLLEELKEKAQQWGVDFLQFNLTSCAPAPETAQIIAAKAGARIKAEALQEMAQQMNSTLAGIDPTLAAVMVGVPLVASASSPAKHREKPAQSDGAAAGKSF